MTLKHLASRRIDDIVKVSTCILARPLNAYQPDRRIMVKIEFDHRPYRHFMLRGIGKCPIPAPKCYIPCLSRADFDGCQSAGSLTFVQIWCSPWLRGVTVCLAAFPRFIVEHENLYALSRWSYEPKSNNKGIDVSLAPFSVLCRRGTDSF